MDQSTRRPIDVLPHLGGFTAVSGPAVSRFVAKRKIDLIHAWGVEAVAAARAVSDTPLILQIYDPLVATREIKRLRALARPAGLAVACSCEVVRRRLVEGGFPRELTVVIRPAVDFSVINQARGGSLREDLGLSWNDHVIIVPEPVSRAAGSLEVVYAVCLRDYLNGGLRVIVPGNSAERRRIERFVARLPIPSSLVTPDSHTPFEQLVSISDTMLITPLRDIPTTSIAWAMAAGVTVIGTATYAVSEMIANKINGLLFKRDLGQTMVASISTLLLQVSAQVGSGPHLPSPPCRGGLRGSEDSGHLGPAQARAELKKLRETARAQAYGVFSLRRYTEQTMQLYDNLLSDQSPSHAITDAAIDT